MHQAAWQLRVAQPSLRSIFLPTIVQCSLLPSGVIYVSGPPAASAAAVRRRGLARHDQADNQITTREYLTIKVADVC